jgi:hypothetical protein
MKNTTVKELIKMLIEMNQDAVVCLGEVDASYSVSYSTAEICRQVKNTSYIDDDGDVVVGDIVYFL